MYSLRLPDYKLVNVDNFTLTDDPQFPSFKCWGKKLIYNILHSRDTQYSMGALRREWLTPVHISISTNVTTFARDIAVNIKLADTAWFLSGLLEKMYNLSLSGDVYIRGFSEQKPSVGVGDIISINGSHEQSLWRAVHHIEEALQGWVVIAR